MIRSLVLPLLALSSAPSVPAGAQCETQKFHPEVDGDRFGVANLEGDLAICRTQERFVLYERTPFGWVPGQELAPSGDLPYAGGAALDGNRLAVNRYDAGDGAVFVFERSGPGQPFVETAQLVPSVAPVVTGYASVALEGDVLAVGVPDLVFSTGGPGHLYVFEHAAGTWSETFADAGIAASPSGSALGWDVAIDAGAVFARSLGFEGPFGSGILGAGVHVYSKSGGSGWAEVQVLDEKGNMLSAEGGRLATLRDDDTVRIHLQVAGTWTETASFPVPDSIGEIALRGATLLVAEPFSDLSGVQSGGAVHVYAETLGAWSLQDTLFASDASSGGHFGDSLALDGDAVLAGSMEDDDAGTNKGAVYAFSLSGQGCPSLTADLFGIDSAVGGTQTLRLAPGAAFAGDLYAMAGSLSGFYPGTPFAGQTIPLNLDLYLEYTLFHGGSPPLSAPFGFLDGAGEATVLVALPADPNLAGLKAHHAYGVADAMLNLVHVSNPVPLVLP